MVPYDFETVHARYHLNSAKWNEIAEYFPEKPEDIIPFSVADMELPLAPQIRDGLKECLDTYVLGYMDPSQEYFDAICGFMKRHHNWEIEPEWISCASGAISAFYGCVKSYTQPGDGVILFTPVYYPMYGAVSANRREIVKCSLVNCNGRYEIDFDLFEELARKPENKMLIFCSPHNPGGRVWSREELERIGNICCDNGVVIVSDELHFDLLAPGVKHTVFSAVSPRIAENCIIITSPSKSFNLAGLITTNVVISSPALRERYREEQLTATHKLKCNMLGMIACTIAYTQCDDWLTQANALIQENCRLVTQFLEREFPCVKAMKMEGTYLLWIDFSALGLDSRFLAQALRKEAKLFFDDGFIFGEEGDGFERWNLACPTRFVAEGIDRLREFLKKYAK